MEFEEQTTVGRVHLHTPTDPSVFVVDDEEIVAATLVAILSMNGYRARYFTSPSEALKAASHECPDLLLSDVIMLDVTGIDLAIQMTTLFPNCKVLLFSGQPETVDLLLAAREQGHNFRLLSKPAHPMDLLSEIERLGVSYAA
jgi:DNA-binding NtrC family response regulator